MGEGKKWIRFEDGITNRQKNKASYEIFRKECCNKKNEEERRVILVFLGVASKKNKDPTKKMIIKSIMNSYSWRKYDDTKFLTVSAIKYNNFDAEYIREEGELPFIVEDRIGYAKADTAREVLDTGGRITDGKKISRWKRLVLGGRYLYSSMQEGTLKYGQILAHVFKHIPLKAWYIIFLFFTMGIGGAQSILNNLKCFEVVAWMVCNIIALCGLVATNSIREEIDYFRSLDYPVIFFNETKKTKGWMKNYIKSYMNGGRGKKPTKPVFYIGVSDKDSEVKGINEFVVSKKNLNWGWVCLCKLIRDLADNPWGEVKAKVNIENETDVSFISMLSTEEEEDQENTQIFRIPKEENDLYYQVEKQKSEYWNYARIHRNIHDGQEAINMLFPIGKSVYVIYKNNNINMDEFIREIIGIRSIITKAMELSRLSVSIQYWIVVQDEVKEKIIETLNIILNQTSLTSDHPLWETIWQYIVGLLMQIDNQNNYIIMKELCDKVWNRRAFKDQSSFEEFYSVEREKLLPYIIARKQER